MGCRLCGSEFGADRFRAEARTAIRAIVAPDLHGLTCSFCGAALSSGQFTAQFLEKLRQLAQFGLTSDVRLLSEPSRAEN
jgi:hypothetical protein